jgi:hypothetical protein
VAVGKRPRASPISASSRAARTVPALGKDVKMLLSGCVEGLADLFGERGDLAADRG